MDLVHIIHVRRSEETTQAFCGEQWTPMPETHMVIKKPCVGCNMAVNDLGP